MKRPHIGITTSYVEGEQRLDIRYVRAVELAGGLPLIVPMLDNDEATLRFAGLLDGLVVTGGPAVEDGLIGDLPPDIASTDPVRMASDKRILQLFLDAQKPVLGICYGMQLANALRGGRIYADVETQKEGSDVHSHKRGGTTHALLVDQDSVLNTLLDSAAKEVNTRHIQAIERAGNGLRIVATAPDGVVEAIENIDGSFIGVQFHPERMGEAGRPLFSHLVKLATL